LLGAGLVTCDDFLNLVTSSEKTGGQNAREITRADDRDGRLRFGHSFPGLYHAAMPIKTKGVKLVSSKKIYAGPAFTVFKDFVQEGKRTAQRDIVRHTGSVVVLAVDESRSKKNPGILLVRQYRYAADSYLWELPAGRIDRNEPALKAARRELLEETGVSARKWERAMWFYASPGFVAESMDIFLARDLSFGVAQPEEDEQIRMKMVPLNDVVEMIMRSRIHDAKTMVGVLWWKQKIS
jgi:ADP-ribose pyrophosphatase